MLVIITARIRSRSYLNHPGSVGEL